MESQLPTKPSELIELALKDLALVEQDPRYGVAMCFWHDPPNLLGDVCAVCFAGAVMAKSLRVEPTAQVLPEDFPMVTRDRLRALDAFRVGEVKEGLLHMSLNHPPELEESRAVEEYHEDAAEFRRDMHQLAQDLAGVGL